ncbi:flagellar filament capping protein FliD [Paenibacillus sp. RC84]|uniref:flagellar filament capping protein FliD n=1 Tax=Paenibacillus sp. RC84 TaxID=3156252 RepID=UPI003515A8AE
MVSSIKFSGMASGIDTDKVISDLMKVERMPLNKLKQQKQIIAWKRDDYREVNTTLSSIRSLVDKLRFSSNYNKQAATSSNPAVVTAATTSSAVSGSYTVEVKSLASSALLTGNTVDLDTKSKVGVSGDFVVEGPEGKNVKITVTPDTTYDSIMKQVNGSGIGVNMSYDKINKRFMLSTTSTGKAASVNVQDGTNSLASNVLKLDTTTTVTGTDATVVINGSTMELKNNSMEFNGLKFNLNGVSTSAVTVKVSQDTENVVGQIKEFVTQYNQLVEKINTKTKAIPSKTYTPLTDEQKEAMTETQINLWESKAKVGMLYKDDILQGTLDATRSSLVGTIKGLPDDFNSLSDIGITFKGYQKGQPSELGKLNLDEKKLQEAVDTNPDAVMKIFTQTSTLDPKDKDYKSQTGFAERIYSDLTNQINKIVKRIGTSTISDAVDGSQLGKSLRDINDKMDTLEDRIKSVQERYYKQFTAMEKAIQKLNSQGSWLSQQLGQL